MTAKDIFWNGLGEHIGGVVRTIDLVNRYLTLRNIVTEVMIPRRYVSSSWTELVVDGKFDRTCIVFENLAVNLRLSAAHIEAITLKLSRDVHQWNGGSQSL